MCDCFYLINGDLRAKNTALVQVHSSANSEPRVVLSTYGLYESDPVIVIADYCPFCGKRYATGDTDINYGLQQWLNDIKTNKDQPTFFIKDSDNRIAKFPNITWYESTFGEYERRDHVYSSSLKFPKTFDLEEAYAKSRNGK